MQKTDYLCNFVDNNTFFLVFFCVWIIYPYWYGLVYQDCHACLPRTKISIFPQNIVVFSVLTASIEKKNIFKGGGGGGGGRS